jgi:hypothetical protein
MTDNELEAAVEWACRALSEMPLEPMDAQKVAVYMLGACALRHTPRPTKEDVSRLIDLALKPQRKRGGDTFLNAPRNVYILMAIRSVSRKFGLKPTLNPVSRDQGRHSACSVVAEAVRRLGAKKLTESAILKIWTDRKRYEQASLAKVALACRALVGN